MLFLGLLERMAVIALAAYVFSQMNMFKRLIKYEVSIMDKLVMVAFFSILSIIGTYIGISVEPGEIVKVATQPGIVSPNAAIANIRPIGAIVAGYVGGPLVGMIVGVIAGTHRYFLGGFTALACSVSTIFEGLIGGLARKLCKNDLFSLWVGFAAGIVAESVQMILILLLSKPYNSALVLEKYIAFPMIIVNSVGVAIFINIIKNTKEAYNRAGAVQSQKALSIAKETIHYIRKGLNKQTAQNVADIIYRIGDVRGVFIGDRTQFLTYFGDSINIETLKERLVLYYKNPSFETISIKNNKKDIYFYCVPLLVGESEFEGVLGLKVKHKMDIDYYFMEFTKGIGELLSTQIELYKLNKIAHEASTAELRLLRAQIHPHFLFNALNTIASFCRTNPLKARELITDLANYFRKTLKKDGDFVPLYEEVELIKSYLSIEKARYGERLKLYMDISDKLMSVKVPAFILQPLIENSIKHGISPKPVGGSIFIKAIDIGERIKFVIEDTGVGMTKERYEEVVNKWPGIGLKNINDRLKFLYGDKFQFNIESAIEEGTKIYFIIPKEEYSNEQIDVCNC